MICVPNRLVIEGMTALSSDHWSLVIGNEHGALSMRGRGRTLPEHPGQQGRGGEKGREKLGFPVSHRELDSREHNLFFPPRGVNGEGTKRNFDQGGTVQEGQRSGWEFGRSLGPTGTKIFDSRERSLNTQENEGRGQNCRRRLGGRGAEAGETQ